MNYFIRLLSVLPVNNQWAAQTDSDWEGNSTFFLENSSDFKYISTKNMKVYFHL